MKLKGIILLVYLFLLPLLKVAGQTVSIPDPGFRACLLERHPSVMDPSQNLIIQEAANLTGSLLCNSRNIKNAEGIQYFTSIGEIDLSNNQLTWLPEISPLTNLGGLKIPDNQLTVLPELNTLVNLTNLDVRRNNLKTLPDLTNNTALVQINVHTNQIDTLPALNTLVNLTYLNVAINNLTKLPNLDNLTSLRDLKCWRNNLTELPPLSQLNNLEVLDATTNEISVMPPFSAQSKIKTIYMERNALTSIPDLSGLPNLQRARLYNNNLTFEDLVPLTSIPGYDTTFPVIPQKNIQIGKTLEVLETEDLTLETGTDVNTNGVVYQWIYNGLSIQISPEDTVSALTSSTSTSGYYYCLLTHPAFPGLTLKTDTIFVNVLPCVNVAGFSTSVAASTCLNAGSVTIEAFDQPKNNLSYELSGDATGKVFTSANGVFKELIEPEYTLTVKAGEKCRKELPGKITVPVEKCKEAFITPNGDGVDDNYYFTQTGNAVVLDKWGNKIKTFQIPAEWNGTGKYGTVSPGLYIVNINNGEDVIKMSVVY